MPLEANSEMICQLLRSANTWNAWSLSTLLMNKYIVMQALGLPTGIELSEGGL